MINLLIITPSKDIKFCRRRKSDRELSVSPKTKTINYWFAHIFLVFKVWKNNTENEHLVPVLSLNKMQIFLTKAWPIVRWCKRKAALKSKQNVGLRPKEEQALLSSPLSHFLCEQIGLKERSECVLLWKMQHWSQNSVMIFVKTFTRP